MKHFYPKIKVLNNTWVRPIFDFKRSLQGLGNYLHFISDWKAYSRLPDSEGLEYKNGYPCLYDRTHTTPFDSHYFYQDIWAFQAIRSAGVKYHIDVGSRSIFVGMLTSITKVLFIDIRPLMVELDNYFPIHGSILSLPFEKCSIDSISCLHVAEHIGLGRYGDPLDPEGTIRAARELARALAPGGQLYFSLPIGRPRVCFNAHRIHSPQQILDYFHDLELVQFSGVKDNGKFIKEMQIDDISNEEYGCGMFHFTK